MAVTDTEIRSQIDAELLSRPALKLKPPCRVFHQAFLIRDKQQSNALMTIALGSVDAPAPAPGVRQVIHTAADETVKWERHGEFVTLTVALADPEASSACMHAIDQTADETLPERIAATHVRLYPVMDMVRTGGMPTSTAASKMIGEDAIAFIKYPPEDDGYTRIEVYLKQMMPDRSGRLVQRLLEIETYRYMAMLSLPLARAAQAELQKLNSDLDDQIEALDQYIELDANEGLLMKIQGLIQEAARLRARTHFRFAGTKAYYAIVMKRLDEVREERLDGFARLSTFLTRRMQPAIDLCVAVDQQQNALDERLRLAAQVLRTKVEIGLARQNQTLLEEIQGSAKTQIIMQRSVEGFSVVAISYYLVSLMAIFLKGGEKAGWFSGWEIYEALLAPLAILLVLYRLRRVLKHTPGTGGDPNSKK